MEPPGTLGNRTVISGWPRELSANPCPPAAPLWPKAAQRRPGWPNGGRGGPTAAGVAQRRPGWARELSANPCPPAVALWPKAAQRRPGWPNGGRGGPRELSANSCPPAVPLWPKAARGSARISAPRLTEPKGKNPAPATAWRRRSSVTTAEGVGIRADLLGCHPNRYAQQSEVGQSGSRVSRQAAGTRPPATASLIASPTTKGTRPSSMAFVPLTPRRLASHTTPNR